MKTNILIPIARETINHKVYPKQHTIDKLFIVQTSPCGEVLFEIWLKAHGKFLKTTRGADECDLKFFRAL